MSLARSCWLVAEAWFWTLLVYSQRSDQPVSGFIGHWSFLHCHFLLVACQSVNVNVRIPVWVTSLVRYSLVLNYAFCQAWTHTSHFDKRHLAAWILGLDAHSKPNSLNVNLKWTIRLGLIGWHGHRHNAFIHQNQNQNMFVTCMPHIAYWIWNLIGGCQRCWWWWPWLSVFLCCVCTHNSSCAIGKLSERMRSPTESIPSGNPTLRCCKRLDDDGSRIISADCRGSTWRVDDDEKAWQFAL